MKDLKRAVFITACISILYVVLSYFLSKTELSLRTWVNVLGQVMTALVLPLLLMILLLIMVHRRDWKIKGFLTGAAVAVYAFCAYWIVLFILFSAESERRLTENLLVTEENAFLGEGMYVYYRPETAFFKVPTTFTSEDKIEYLENKYHRKFVVDRRDDKEICDQEFSDVKVSVYLSNMELNDDYVEGMVIKYLLDGYKALGMERDYYLSDYDTGVNGYLCMKFEGEDDISAAAADIGQLIQYAMGKTDFFHDKTCYIRFSYGEGKGCITESILFGALGDVQESYIPSTKQIEDLIRMEYLRSIGFYEGVMEERYDEKSPDNSKNTETGNGEDKIDSLDAKPVIDAEIPHSETENGVDSDDISEDAEYEPDDREIAAQILYDAVFAKEGYSYEVCYNAKGNLYIDLGSKTSEESGSKKTEYYRFVYDRPSKNGACELFVLYRSAGGMDDEVIVDMYAVETATKKVIASGKKTWSDVGTEEYREMTGE